MSEEANYKSYFDNLERLYSPISSKTGKRVEDSKTEYFELLHNDDNKKLIEQYLSKMGVKERYESNDNLNALSSTKEKVYKKILQSKFEEEDDYLPNGLKNMNKINKAKKSKSNPKDYLVRTKYSDSNMKLSKYFSLATDKMESHGKNTLRSMIDNVDSDNETLIGKNRVKSAQKFQIHNNLNKVLSPKSSHLDLNSISMQKYRKVNITKEEEALETKLKSMIVGLRRTIETQKAEISKLSKTNSENTRYISKLEGMLNEDTQSRKNGSKAVNVNSSIGSNHSKLDAKLLKNHRGDREVKSLNFDSIKLKELFTETQMFAKIIGDMVKILETTSNDLKKYIADTFVSHGLGKIKDFKKIESYSDIPLMDSRTDIIKVHETVENIVRIMRSNYGEFNYKLESKYSYVDALPTNDVSANSSARTYKHKSRKEGINSSNRLLFSDNKKQSFKSDFDSYQKGISYAKKIKPSGHNSKNNLSNLSSHIDLLSPKKRYDSRSTPRDIVRAGFVKKNSMDTSKDKSIHTQAKESTKEEKMKNFVKRLDKRINTINPNHNSIAINREVKRMNTMGQTNIDIKKMSNLIKQISTNKRTSQEV